MKRFRRLPALLVLLVLTFSSLFPIYWMAKTSFATQSSIFRRPPTLLLRPVDFTLSNYQKVLEQSPVALWPPA